MKNRIYTIMGLGAAGCGYEYDNAEYKCPFLGGNLFGFKCLKYHKDLNKHERSGHPLRDNQCSGDASKECESKIAKEKAEETRRVRMQNALSRFAAWCLLFCLADTSNLR